MSLLYHWHAVFHHEISAEETSFVRQCCICHRVCDAQANWHTLISARTVGGSIVSHGICPTCLHTHYSDLYPDNEP